MNRFIKENMLYGTSQFVENLESGLWKWYLQSFNVLERKDWYCT